VLTRTRQVNIGRRDSFRKRKRKVKDRLEEEAEELISLVST